MDEALLLVSIAIAIRSLQRAGLLEAWEAAAIVERGADTMTLLDLGRTLTDRGGLRDYEGQPGDDLRARGAGLARLAVEVLDAGGWRALLASAPAHAIETWAALVADLVEAHRVEPTRLQPEGVGIEVDMSARTMRVRMTMRLMVDGWSVSRVDAPGEEDHGWPLVTGRIYGDPRWADGTQISLYAEVEDERTTIGMHGIRYDLRKPA